MAEKPVVLTLEGEKVKSKLDDIYNQYGIDDSGKMHIFKRSYYDVFNKQFLDPEHGNLEKFYNELGEEPENERESFFEVVNDHAKYY